MPTSTLILVLIVLTVLAYQFGRARSLRVAGGARGARKLHSLPSHYGLLTAIWCGLPALIVVLGWQMLDQRIIADQVVASMSTDVQALSEGELSLVLNDVQNVIAGNVAADAVSPEVAAAAGHWQRLDGLSRTAVAVLAFCVALAGGWITLAPHHADDAGAQSRGADRALGADGLLADRHPDDDRHHPVGAVRVAAVLPAGAGDGVHLRHAVEPADGDPRRPGRFVGRVRRVAAVCRHALIAFIAMAIAVPVGLFSAIYLAEYASRRFRAITKPVLEVLAGIPTVVYGFFAALTVAPLLRGLGEGLGLEVASESALAAGLVMGIMIIPFVSSLADDMITAVPQAMRDGSFGLGATRSETIRKVVLPAALPGIVGGVLLAVSRAIGETMIVVMAAGLVGEPDGQSARGGHDRDRADRDAAGRRPGVRQPEDAGGVCARAWCCSW